MKKSYCDGKFKIAKNNLKWTCRFHPTDWFHEFGCPHCEWTKEQLQEALETAKATIVVLQNELYREPLYTYGTFTEGMRSTTIEK